MTDNVDSITENIVDFLNYTKQKITPEEKAYIKLNVEMAYHLGGRDTVKELQEAK